MLSCDMGSIAGGTYSRRQHAISHSVLRRLASHAGLCAAPVSRPRAGAYSRPRPGPYPTTVRAVMAHAVERPFVSSNACSFASFRCKVCIQSMHYVNLSIEGKPFARSQLILVNHANILTTYYITTYYYFSTTFLLFSRDSQSDGTLYNTGLEILDNVGSLNVRDEKTRKVPFLPVDNYPNPRRYVTYSVRVKNREFRANARTLTPHHYTPVKASIRLLDKNLIYFSPAD